ncbi:MAG TPA: GNAT family N-acetyltransferase [Thermoanaerobaculia bacterium]|nr:GNAT family N-acetyltransferase [Thermoanaerobaculia bacterium]
MIRKAVPADVPEIERVMRASMADLGAHWYDGPQVSSAVRFIAVVDRQLIGDGTYFVIEEEGRVVACGGWSARMKLFSGPEAQDRAEGWLNPETDAARIRAMFVDPAFARRGLGRRILEAAEADAARAGFRTFELMATLPGVPLYRACGYEEIERTEIELPDGARLECIRMQRTPPARS